MIKCTKCKRLKPESEFPRGSYGKNKRKYWCKRCHANSAKKLSLERKSKSLCVRCGIALPKDYDGLRCDSCRIKANASSKAEIKKLKLEVFNGYGGPICACCGEKHIEFLSIDHVHGGGTKHRESLGKTTTMLYRWLKRNNYPAGFQVLCHNCNQAKGLYGYCPHDHEREIDWDVPLCGIDLTQRKEAVGL